jgi:predicted transport protein
MLNFYCYGSSQLTVQTQLPRKNLRDNRSYIDFGSIVQYSIIIDKNVDSECEVDCKMSSYKLFNIVGTAAEEVKSEVFPLEKELQNLFEQNMAALLGLKFIKTEYALDNGSRRIDSVALDENYSPVIIEYKKSAKDNVINQGLDYLTWIVEHKGDFEILVLETLGDEVRKKVDWSTPRLICVANDFQKYDERAIRSMNANITLVKYVKYGEQLLLDFFAQTENNRMETVPSNPNSSHESKSANRRTAQTAKEILGSASPLVKAMYAEIQEYITSLDDSIIETVQKQYYAYKRADGNVISLNPHKGHLNYYFKLKPKESYLDENMRDVSGTGHWGTGDLEFTLRNKTQIAKLKSIVDEAIERR